MKKIDLGQAITIFANIGVIAGIVFLAYELRQNTEAIRLDGAQFMASEQAAFNRLWTDPGIARIWAQYSSDGYESLSPQEKRQVFGVATSYFQLQQGYYYQWRAGSFDQVIWNGRHRQLVGVFQQEFYRPAWEIWGNGANDNFRDYIENVIIPEGNRAGGEQ